MVWRIKRAHLDRHIRWNDMAVITHDNAAVRLFGERLAEMVYRCGIRRSPVL